MKAGALALAVLAGGPAAGQDCRQALAIGLDVSGSVDSREYALQVGGMVEALGDPEVRDLLLSATDRPVALTVFEWSGPRDQFVREAWTEITGPEVLDRFLERLGGSERLQGDSLTAVGSAMAYGRSLLRLGPACRRLTLDLSGDGINNSGPRPREVGMTIDGREVTVNGLVIGRAGGGLGPPIDPSIAELSAWYMAEVIRGPGAFVETALGFDDFAPAMRRKLVRELTGLFADAPPPAQDRRG